MVLFWLVAAFVVQYNTVHGLERLHQSQSLIGCAGTNGYVTLGAIREPKHSAMLPPPATPRSDSASQTPEQLAWKIEVLKHVPPARTFEVTF